MVTKRSRTFGIEEKNTCLTMMERIVNESFRSVGCLLYEMCTFQHAFDGKGLMNVIYKVVEGKAPELPRAYSKALNDLLKKY